MRKLYLAEASHGAMLGSCAPVVGGWVVSETPNARLSLGGLLQVERMMGFDVNYTGRLPLHQLCGLDRLCMHHDGSGLRDIDNHDRMITMIVDDTL
jgi:hypothetical protein